MTDEIDFESRYAPPKVVPITMHRNPETVAMEQVILDNPPGSHDNTVASALFNYDRTVRDLATLAMLDRSKARLQMQELEKNIEFSYKTIGQAASVGDTDSAYVNTMRDNAVKMSQLSHRDATITLPDGTQTTLGMYLGEDYDDYQRNSIANDGFTNARVQEMYTGQDQDRKRLMSIFVDPVLKARAVAKGTMGHPLRIQYSDAASFFADHIDEMHETFGTDGTFYLAQNLLQYQADAGGLSQLAGALLEQGKNSQTKGLELARKLYSAYTTVSSFTYPESGVSGALTPEQKRDSALAVVKAIGASGGQIDFDNPITKNAMRDAASVFAMATADGINLFHDATGSGMSIASEIGKFIAEVSRTGSMPQDNIITQQIRLRENLTSRTTGGADSVRYESLRTGSASQYENNMARKLGRKSSNISADDIADRVVGTTIRSLTPFMYSGVLESDALASLIRFDESGKAVAASEAGAQLLNQLTTDFMKGAALRGEGGKAAAAMLANQYLQSLRDGDAFNVEDRMQRLTFDRRFGEANPEATKELLRWYVGNVSARFMFDEDMQEVKANLMEFAGYDEKRANERIAVLRRNLVTAVRDSRFGEGKLTPEMVKAALEREKRQGRWLEWTGRYINNATGEYLTLPNSPEPAQFLPASVPPQGYRRELVEKSGDANLAVRHYYDPKTGRWLTSNGDFQRNRAAFKKYFQGELEAEYRTYLKMRADLESKLAKNELDEGL